MDEETKHDIESGLVKGQRLRDEILRKTAELKGLVKLVKVGADEGLSILEGLYSIVTSRSSNDDDIKV